MLRRKNEIDMLNGSVFPKIIAFSVPIMLSGWLQLLYNAADLIVVGRCAGESALAAVGATTPLIVMMTNFFITMSIGANAAVARSIGAKDPEAVSRTAHTGILFGFFAGLFIGLAGIFGGRIFLKAMDTPNDILNSSVIYLRYYSIGMPFTMIYNFCAAVLRAKGDTKRPLYILSGSGIINVILNLLLTKQVSFGFKCQCGSRRRFYYSLYAVVINKGFSSRNSLLQDQSDILLYRGQLC